MTTAKIIVGSEDLAPRRRNSEENGTWRIVAVSGVLFVVAGLADISLAVLPANLGDAPQRFGTAVGVASGWPILALGSVAAQVGAAGLDSVLLNRLVRVLHVMAMVTLVALIGALLVDRGGVAALAGGGGATVNRGFLRALISSAAFLVVHTVGWRSGAR